MCCLQGDDDVMKGRQMLCFSRLSKRDGSTKARWFCCLMLGKRDGSTKAMLQSGWWCGERTRHVGCVVCTMVFVWHLGTRDDSVVGAKGAALAMRSKMVMVRWIPVTSSECLPCECWQWKNWKRKKVAFFPFGRRGLPDAFLVMFVLREKKQHQQTWWDGKAMSLRACHWCGHFVIATPNKHRKLKRTH